MLCLFWLTSRSDLEHVSITCNRLEGLVLYQNISIKPPSLLIKKPIFTLKLHRISIWWYVNFRIIWMQQDTWHLHFKILQKWLFHYLSQYHDDLLLPHQSRDHHQDHPLLTLLNAIQIRNGFQRVWPAIFSAKNVRLSVVYKCLKTARTWLWRHYRSANSKTLVPIASLRMWIIELADRKWRHIQVRGVLSFYILLLSIFG